MPRNISFALTTPQFIDRSKTVTRRMRWLRVKVGDQLMGVEKCMGLGRGGKIKRLGLIEVTLVSQEPLRRIFDEPEYGRLELVREGFPLMTAKGFIEMFCLANKGCTPDSHITRIEYKYLEPECPYCHKRHDTRVACPEYARRNDPVAVDLNRW